jgi:hypothetical protein
MVKDDCAHELRVIGRITSQGLDQQTQLPLVERLAPHVRRTVQEL